MISSRREGGAALVVVLLIIAVISIVAVTVNDQVRYAVQRLENQRHNEQAHWYVLGGEQLARVLLAEETGESTIHLGQAWATRDAVFPIEGGTLMGFIEDRQACFNINNLQQVSPPPEAAGVDEEKPGPQQLFGQVLSAAGVPPETASQLVDRVPDWLDADFTPTGYNGAEDLHYSSLDLPYQPPNNLMLSATELLLMASLESEHWQRLRTLICALPETGTGINVNTLQPEQALLLSAVMSQQIAPDAAEELIGQRPENGWKSVDEFLASPQLAGMEIPENARAALSVTSSFFRATIDVQYRNVEIRLYSMMRTTGDGVQVYAREYGELF